MPDTRHLDAVGIWHDLEADVSEGAIYELARIGGTDDEMMAATDEVTEYERRRAAKAASRAHEQRDVRVFWSEEDGGFIAEAIGMPGCSAFGLTRVIALRELDDAIVAWRAAKAQPLNPHRRHDAWGPVVAGALERS